MNSSLNWALKRTSRDLQVDYKTVAAVYKSYWKFIREQIASNALKKMSLEDIVSADTNFNIPYIGKLYVDEEKVKKYKRQLNYYQNVKHKKD